MLKEVPQCMLKELLTRNASQTLNLDKIRVKNGRPSFGRYLGHSSFLAFECFRRLKNATTADNKRIFTDAGDLATFQYEILNLQSSEIRKKKEWKKVGEFVNGRLSSFQTVIWPGRSFQTPREGTDMGSVRVTAKVSIFAFFPLFSFSLHIVTIKSRQS